MHGSLFFSVNGDLCQCVKGSGTPIIWLFSSPSPALMTKNQQIRVYIVVLFLVFKGISVLFSIVARSTYIPTKSGGFPFLHIVSNTYYL